MGWPATPGDSKEDTIACMKGHKMNNIQVIAEAYHRNGVAGEGFTARIVRDPEEGMMLLVTFDSDPMRTAALHIGRLGQYDVEFGSNSYRGDTYAWALGLVDTGEKAALAFGSKEF
jgi:hypothetical protein